MCALCSDRRWLLCKPSQLEAVCAYWLRWTELSRLHTWQDGRQWSAAGHARWHAIAFFSYIGFDAVSTPAEEARNPSKDVPIGILASLLVCTLFYIAVIAVLTGMVRYDKIDLAAPVSKAFEQVGLGWARFLIAAGGLRPELHPFCL